MAISSVGALHSPKQVRNGQHPRPHVSTQPKSLEPQGQKKPKSLLGHTGHNVNKLV